MRADGEHHRAARRQALQRLALDAQPQALAGILGGDRVRRGLRHRLKRRRVVDDAPVEPPHQPARFEHGEEAVDRRFELRGIARHRRVDRAERPADLVGEPPARRRAQRRPNQPVGSIALRQQQAQILLHQPAGKVERMKPRLRDVPGFPGGRDGEMVAGAAVDIGMVLRQVPGQQRQQLGRCVLGFRQRREDLGVSFAQQDLLGGEIGGKALVDLEPGSHGQGHQPQCQPKAAALERQIRGAVAIRAHRPRA